MSGATAARTGHAPSGVFDELIERLVLGGLAAGGVALALFAVAPLLAVALPALVAWRLIELLARSALRRWHPQVGVLPALVPLAGAALVAGAGYASLRMTGRAPLGFVDLQLDTGKVLLDAAIDAHKSHSALAPGGLAPATFALDYVRRVWPYALPTGVVLALSGDAGLRWRTGQRRALAAEQERHAQALYQCAQLNSRL